MCRLREGHFTLESGYYTNAWRTLDALFVDPTVVGLLIGLAAAAGVAHIIQSLLFGVSPLDAVPFIVAPGLLGAVAVVACLLPGLRAAATDPITALRAQ